MSISYASLAYIFIQIAYMEVVFTELKLRVAVARQSQVGKNAY